MDKIEALLRGFGQGATLGWGDDLIPMLTPTVDDGTGIPREYAAGSADADLKASERAANQEALDKYPGTYRSAQVLAGLPSSIAASGLGGAGIAASGLASGIRGGIEGAGLGDEDRLKGAAWGAGPAALFGMAGAAAPKALTYIKDIFKGGPPPGGLAPAFATAGEAASGAAPSASSAASSTAKGAGTGAIVNKSTQHTLPPPKRGAAKTAEAPKSEEHIPRHKATPPPSSLEAEVEAASDFGGSPRVPTERTPAMPNMSPRDFPSRQEYFAAQRRALNEAWGKPPDWEPPTAAEMSAQRGPSMSEALAEENSPAQLGRLPRLDSEYAEAAANAGVRRAAQRAARGKTTPLPMQEAKTPIPAGNSGPASFGGEFELPSQEYGEFDFSPSSLMRR